VKERKRRAANEGGALGDFGDTLGGILGAGLGARYAPGTEGVTGLAGSKLGRAMGKGANWLKGQIQTIMGSGDYVIGDTTRYNVLTHGDQIPHFMNGKRSVTVSHQEYIGEVSSSSTIGAFQIKRYTINPGNSSTFPAGCAIANCFTNFEIKGLVIEFKSTSSDYSTSVGLGQVIMCFTDPLQKPFTGKQLMEQQDGCVSCKPSVNMMCAMECAKGTYTQDKFFVRAFSSSGALQRQEEPVSFWLATNGNPGASSNLGELWISYIIEYSEQCENVEPCQKVFSMLSSSTFSPAVSNGLGLSIAQQYYIRDPTNAAGYTNYALSAYGVDSPANMWGIYFADKNTINLTKAVPGQVIEYSYWCYGTAAAVVVDTPTVTGLSLLTFSQGGPIPMYSPSATTTAFIQRLSYLVTLVNPSIQVAMATSTFPTAATVVVTLTQSNATFYGYGV